MLSICIPTYNAAETLPLFLKSLEPLPPERVEMIFVNDASTDGTQKLLEAFAAKRPNTRILVHARNQGVSDAKRTGLAEVRGEYVRIMGADDEVMADALLQSLEKAESGGYAVVLDHYQEAYEDGSRQFIARDGPAPGQSLLSWFWLNTKYMEIAMTVRSDIMRACPLHKGLTLGEDVLFMIDVFALVTETQEKYLFSGLTSYRYYVRQGSNCNPLPSQLFRFAERVRIRLDAQEQAGQKLVAKGILTKDEFRQGMAFISARYPGLLAQAGLHLKAVQERSRLRRLYGHTEHSRQRIFQLSKRTLLLAFLERLGLKKSERGMESAAPR